MSELDDRARDVIVAILGGGRGTRLNPLTSERSKPAVPIAGKYRLIDVPISNALHSRMQRILVMTQFNSVSLHRHIALTYQFDAFTRGYVQILAAQQTESSDRWFQGTADAVRQNLALIQGLRGDLVLILSGDHMYRMDYRHMLREHVRTGADITIGVQPCSEVDVAGFGAVRIDGEGRVREFREKPSDDESRAGMEVSPEQLARHGVGPGRPYLASMGIYLFRKEVLVEVLNNQLHDFGGDIIPGCVRSRRVQSYFFDGYWRDIGTIRSFYETHMDLVRSDPPFDLYDPDWLVYTRPRFLPPARIDDSRIGSTTLGEGSRLIGATIEDSVIGIGSRIDHATVRRSLVMGVDLYPGPGGSDCPPVGIGPGSVVENAIVDKNARIGRKARIVNEAGAREADGPGWVIRDGVVVVQRNAEIPDGTVV